MEHFLDFPWGECNAGNWETCGGVATTSVMGLPACFLRGRDLSLKIDEVKI